MSNSGILQMNDYTAQARTYWWVTTLLGLAALLISVFGLSRLPTGTLLLVVTGAVLAAIAGLVPVSIPGTKTSVSAAEIFVFLLLLTCGPDAAVVAAAVEAACISLRTSKRWTSRLASPAMAAIAMFVSSRLFVLVLPMLPSAGNNALIAKIVLLLVVAVVYFAVGTLLIASLIKLKRSEPIQPLTIVCDHAWLGFGYACSAAIAGLLQTAFSGSLEMSTLIAATLLTAALLSMLHLYYRRMGQA